MLVIAHRGGTGLRPENTIAAMEHALSLGADGVEFDVHLTKDNVPIVHHDDRPRPDVARDASGNWLDVPTTPFSEMTLAQVKALDVGRLRPGSGYASLYPEQRAVDGARIPTLEEVLAFLGSASDDAIALIEIKSSFDPEALTPKKLVDAIVDVVSVSPMRSRSRFMAFDWRALDHAATIAPDMPRGHTTIPGPWMAGETPAEHKLLPKARRDALAALVAGGPGFLRGFAASRWSAELLDQIARDDLGFWTANHYDVTAAMAQKAADCNVDVFAWTPDKEADLERLAALNIAGVITDYPDRALTVQTSLKA